MASIAYKRAHKYIYFAALVLRIIIIVWFLAFTVRFNLQCRNPEANSHLFLKSPTEIFVM